MSEYDLLCRLANLESKLLEYDREIRRLDERLLAQDVKYQQLNMKSQERHTLQPYESIHGKLTGDVVDGIFNSID
jgi:hypothetical protein